MGVSGSSDKRVSLKSLALLTTLACACALPPEVGKSNFVSREEVMVASLTEDGLAQFKSGQFGEARLTFLKAQALAPSSRPIKRNLAITFTRLGEAELALEIYRELLAEDESNPELQFEYAQALMGAGELDAALVVLKAALQKAFNMGDQKLILANARVLSDLSFRLGLEDEAICYSDTILAYRKDQAEIIRHTKLLLGVGRFEEAASLIENMYARAVIKNEPALAHQLALAKLGQEKYSEFESLEDLALNALDEESLLSQEIQNIRNRLKESGEEKEPRAVTRENLFLPWPLVERFQG